MRKNGEQSILKLINTTKGFIAIPKCFIAIPKCLAVSATKVSSYDLYFMMWM